MSEQRHIIQRQTIQLNVRNQTEARAIQAEVSRIYRLRIVPLIDQVCSQLSEPDRIHRIERLDLNIGILDPKNLEESLVSKVGIALRRELAAELDVQKRATRNSLKSSSHLELFACFARTGRLPWWAETSRPQLLYENLEQLLQTETDALRHLLEELAGEENSMRRLIAAYPDKQLAGLCRLLLSRSNDDLSRDVSEIIDALFAALPAGGVSYARLRQATWNNLLFVASHGGQEYATIGAIYTAAVQRTAADLGVPVPDLLAALLPRIRGLLSVPMDIENAKQARGAGPSPATGGQLASRLAALQAGGGTLEDIWEELRLLIPALPSEFQARWLELIPTHPVPNDTARVTAIKILALLQTGSTPLGLPPDSAIRLARTIQTALSAEITIPRPARTMLFGPDKDDAVPVENAGLVILWPFLTHFFEHLNFLDDDRRFKDLASRQRAAGLLQVIASQTSAPGPEYLLPLNKLLCGLESSEVFDFGAPLLESEAQECSALLAAVIAQAPILHEMSADGFRGSFLLRRGMLSTLDSLWLLRVERQTYDVILERFPWSWEWVKLPWMETALRVEW